MKAKDLCWTSTRLLKGYVIDNGKAFSDELMMRALGSAFLLSSLAHPDKVAEALRTNSDVFILATECDNGLSFLNTNYEVAGDLLEGVALYYARGEADASARAMGRHVMVMTLTQVKGY